jgi:hypothetical protein
LGSLVLAVLAAVFATIVVASPRQVPLAAFAIGGIPIALITGDPSLFGPGGINADAAYLGILLLALLATLAVRPLHLARIGYAQWPAITYLVYAALSLTWTVDVLDGLRMLAKLLAPPLFFWAAVSLDDGPEFRRRLVLATYGTCLCSLALAAANLVTHGGLAPLNPVPNSLGFSSLTVPYSSPANFSMLVATGALLAYCEWLSTRHISRVILFAIFAAGVLLAFTRITIAGLLAGILLVHWFAGQRGSWFRYVAMAGVLAIATVLLTSDALMHRMFYDPAAVVWSDLFLHTDTFLDNVNTSGRSQYWARALREIPSASAMRGAGVGSVEHWMHVIKGNQLHSEVLRLYVDLGWIGVSLAGVALASNWRWHGKLRRRLKAARIAVPPLTAVAPALSALYVATLLTDNSLNYVTNFAIFTFGLNACGLGAATSALESREAPPSTVTPTAAQVRFPHLLR